jgi:hypothetical protein
VIRYGLKTKKTISTLILEEKKRESFLENQKGYSDSKGNQTTTKSLLP